MSKVPMNIRICTSLTLSQRQNANTVEPQYSMAVHILNLRALGKKQNKTWFSVKQKKKNTLQHFSPCAVNRNLSVTRSKALVLNHVSL